jgi:hypothetical protein
MLFFTTKKGHGMRRKKFEWTMAFICCCLIAAWSLGQTACGDDDDRADDDDDNDNDNDDNDNDDNDNDDNDNDDTGDDDDDTAGDDDDDDTAADDDDDTGECNPPTWGSGFTVGQAIPNWSISAIFDQDGDGSISGAETTPVTTTLEEIHCNQGKNALVLYMHDRD